MTIPERIAPRLARTLVAIAEGSGPEFASLQAPGSGAYVQFTLHEGRLILEAVCNEFLPADEQLSEAQIAWLGERGFSEPDPNHRREIELEPGEGSRRAQMTQVASEAVKIMRELYGVPSDDLEVQTDD